MSDVTSISDILRFTHDRSLVELGTNYAGAESEGDMGNGALSFDMDTAGRTAVNLMLSDIQSKFNGKMWGHNGPKLVSRVLQIMCGIKHVSRGRLNDCLIYVCVYITVPLPPRL
jgi:hypothetical protein